jgi:acetolactate synthase-1/2/3 large subunit
METIKSGISGAEAVTLALIEEGVDTVFGYPGGSNLPIYDSFFTHKDKINHILVRHEQGAVHAAEGYAAAAKKPGVCMVTSGPGATNLLTGIADAQLDSVPVVCITGQVNVSQLGYDAFQETDVVGFSMPVTKWNYQITRASEIAETIAKAFFIARSGRPGPVLIDITKNAQNEIIENFEYRKCTGIRSYHPKLKPQEEALNEAVMLLNNAKRPFMVLGHGVLLSGCKSEVKTLAEKLNMPAACTLLGLSSIESSHPLFAGMVGLHGNLAANKMTNECDVLLAVGMRFADRVTGNVQKYAPQAKVIHIEIDPSEINKVIAAAVPIVSDAKSALTKILPLTRSSSHASWIEKMNAYKKQESETVFSRDLDKKSKILRMGRVVKAVSDMMPEGTVIVTDVGQNQMASARYFDYKKNDFLVTSGGLGTMGFALPASIGASSIKKDGAVVCVMGDGGFQMTMEELGAVMQYKLPVKMVLLNNNFLGMIRQLQELYYSSRYYFGEMANPDFVKIVEAYGINAKKITSQEDLEPAVKEMFETPGPYFLEVQVEKSENIYPVIPAGAGVDELLLSPEN